MGWIEKYGSGIGRIVNHFVKANLPEPTFQNQGDGFLVTVFSAISDDVTDDVTDNAADYVIDNVTENVTENRLDAIIDNILKDPTITTTALSNQLKIARMTLHRDLGILKERGILIRVGAANGGHWKILKH